MTEYNRTENPMNTSEGWKQPQKAAVGVRNIHTNAIGKVQVSFLKKSPEELHEARVKAALRRNGGEYSKNTYKKNGGRHEHRIVAEQKLGRPLRPGEIVHHIDGDKKNNSPDNLMVFENQAQHARWHVKNGDFCRKKRGDALCQ